MTITPTRDTAAQEALSRRLADPRVADALSSLLDHADLLAVLVDGLDGFVARSEVIGDSLVSGLTDLRAAAASNTELQDAGVDPGAVLRSALSLAAVLPRAAPSLVSVFERGGAENLDLFTAALARGNADYVSDPVQVTGPLSLVRLLKDPDINRALRFLATIARAIGRELELAAAQAPAGTSTK
jgi:hypothetical protein